MVKVLHLISTNVFSGAENVACQIIRALSDNENYKMVYCSSMGSNKTSLEDRKIEILELKKFDYFSVKEAIKKYKPDIIHAHDAKASVMAALCSKNVKIISQIHGNHEDMRISNVKTFLYQHFSKRYSSVIWVSQSALDEYYYKDKILSKSVVIYNVIDINEVYQKANLDKSTYDFDIIYLGRLSDVKDPIRFLNIMSKVKEQYANLKVAIVGSGEMLDEVNKKIRELHLENCIKMYGFLPNPYKILESSKILVMTSKHEGTPMCALEAIACGVLIIATITDGLKEIVKDGITGYLSNEDEVLVEKIVSLLSNRSELEEMHKKVMEYNKEVNNIENYKEKMREIYRIGS